MQSYPECHAQPGMLTAVHMPGDCSSTYAWLPATCVFMVISTLLTPQAHPDVCSQHTQSCIHSHKALQPRCATETSTVTTPAPPPGYNTFHL